MLKIVPDNRIAFIIIIVIIIIIIFIIIIIKIIQVTRSMRRPQIKLHVHGTVT